ncbi:hypothetical protein QT979_15205 [Microcoleus sp. w2-18bC1]|uniref:hypothetical protein n=1 Tax=unclassified Microcoleus TaxID=2642155 RepID=UPI002FD38931
MDSKETGFFTGIKGFKGYEAVFASIKPGFYVISALAYSPTIARLQPHLETLAG